MGYDKKKSSLKQFQTHFGIIIKERDTISIVASLTISIQENMN